VILRGVKRPADCKLFGTVCTPESPMGSCMKSRCSTAPSRPWLMGARPLYLSASFIVEEGYALAELKEVVWSMAEAARAAGVLVVAGDTKVVEQGKGDGAFIATTGVGVVPRGRAIGGANARPGDVVLLSGTIGDHGVAVMSRRASLEFETAIESDSAALHGLVAALRAHPLGAQAARIGEVVADDHRLVQMATRFGGQRVVDWLTGEQLPRIC
jgi:hydrogenase maturation factor